MKIYEMKDFVGGWFIGDFNPSVYKTQDVEVCFKTHVAGERWPKHYHIATEINYLIRGEMTIQDTKLFAGQIFVIDPYEVADPVFHTDVELIVVKIPGKPGDKFIVEEDHAAEKERH